MHALFRARQGIRFAVLLLVLSVLPFAASSATKPTAAYAVSGISQHMGFGSCDSDTQAEMQAFWSNTPYWNYELYIGGSSALCPVNSASWVSTLRNMGWHFLPLWVGPQAPCNTAYGSRFSYDTGTAYSQGRNEAGAAYSKMVALGIDTAGTPVIYDLEGFNTGNSSCLNASKSFVQGWVDFLHIAPAQKAGLYSSTCSGLAYMASLAAPPDFIDGAEYSGDLNTNHMSCVNSGNWVFNQRHKQYQGDHPETWNGVRLPRVDSDCSNGPVWPGPDLFGSQGCA
jgi:hypothetical protein